MSNYKSYDENIPTEAESNYDVVASQEEIYPEEVEEELRAILIFSNPPPSRGETTRPIFDAAESLDERLNHAVEELITGDSDGPPLSEEWSQKC